MLLLDRTCTANNSGYGTAVVTLDSVNPLTQLLPASLCARQMWDRKMQKGLDGAIVPFGTILSTPIGRFLYGAYRKAPNRPQYAHLE